MGVESLFLNIALETRVKAGIETTFDALLEELGPAGQTLEGKPLSLKIEPWPGGRWYRDLGDGNGHLWAHVQSIKRPTLLEFYGPLFMSYAAVSNVQYRLSEEKGVTLIKFHHLAMGTIQDEDRQGMPKGWAQMLQGIRERAERGGSR